MKCCRPLTLKNLNKTLSLQIYDWQHTGAKLAICTALIEGRQAQKLLPPLFYLGRDRCHSHDKMDLAFPLRFCDPKLDGGKA